MPFKVHGATAGLIQSIEQAKQRTLSRTAGAKDCQDFARPQLEGNIFQDYFPIDHAP